MFDIGVHLPARDKKNGAIQRLEESVFFQGGYKPKDRGFTLVELLFAIFIFAIVIASVYGSYRATFSIVQGSESHMKMSRRARVALERIAEDLNYVVTGPGGSLRGESQEYSGARGDNLSFVSTAHLALKKSDTLSGHTLIEYSVELDEDSNLLNLYRSDTLLLPGVDTEENDSNRHLLCRGLNGFRFTYVGEDGSETEEWQSDEGESTDEDEGPARPLLPFLMYVEVSFAESLESETGTLFKTAVALPQQLKEKE